jgi:hypothetical protein
VNASEERKNNNSSPTNGKTMDELLANFEGELGIEGDVGIDFDHNAGVAIAQEINLLK